VSLKFSYSEKLDNGFARVCVKLIMRVRQSLN